MTTFISLIIIIGSTIAFLRNGRLSLVVVMPIFFLQSVQIGCLYIRARNGLLISGGGIPETFVTNEIAEIVSHKLHQASLAYILGVFLATLIFPRINYRFDLKLFDYAISNKYLLNLVSFYLIFTNIFIILNLHELWKRNTYLYVSSGSLLAALRYLIPFISLSSIYFIFNYPMAKFRLILVISETLFIEFSSASRSFAIIVSALFFMFFIRFKNLFVRALVGSLGILCTLLSFKFVILSRGLFEHGFSAYFNFSNASNTVETTSVFGNYFSIIPITYLGLSLDTPQGYLVASFNPLLGKWTNWYQIASNLNVNPWTPSGALAQIANLGQIQSIMVWILLGCIFQFVGYLAQKSKLGGIAVVVCTIFSFNACLQYLQYSLRPGMRFVYAAMIFLALTKALTKPLFASRRTRSLKT